MSLSAKHKAFCDEYLANGMNALQAYKSVYKVSDKVAGASGVRLLDNVNVKEYLQEERQKIAKRLNITKEELLLDLQEIKNSNKGIRDGIANKLEITREFLIKEYLELIESAKSDDNFIDRGNWNKSLAQLSKLLGLDAPIKQQTEITISEQPLLPDDEE